MALWKGAWVSADACEAACKSWASCVQWSYVEDLCNMDDKLIMGQGYAPAMSERKTALKTTSGWLQGRLDGWHCD
jgi:heme A synthase